MTITTANNTNIQSWIEVPENSDFPIQNIPFGIFKTNAFNHHVATIIGTTVIDLYALAKKGFFDEFKVDSQIFNQPYLNNFIALGKPTTLAIREKIITLFEKNNAIIRDNAELKATILYAEKDVEMLMPVQVPNYTDFYSSIDHATNVGKMFRDPANALLPNWRYIPVGYHGRASSIVVSGTPIHRPKGQTRPDDNLPPVFGPTKQLDFELEMAFVIGKNTNLGESISTKNAEDYIFGMVLFNDWSARDIQKWEYVPLGPFLSKNFGSSISPWIVVLEALEPFRVKGETQVPEVFDYLKYEGKKNIDIQLEVYIAPETAKEPTKIATSNYKYLYWNMNQQLAHHTINGCNVQIGDMYASGTISGPEKESFGSMLELTWRGTQPLKLNDGTERKFINDNDTVIMKGFAQKDNIRIGFGCVKTKILPAI